MPVELSGDTGSSARKMSTGPPVAVVLLACLVVQIGFGGYGIGARQALSASDFARRC